MTWGAPLTFGRAVGKVTTTEFRMAIVKNGTTLGMCIVIPGITAKELGWTAQTSLEIQPGEGDHWGWIRLNPSQSPGARRLHTTGKSANLRFKTPMWPWLIGREQAPRPLEVVEHRLGAPNGLASAWIVDVRLPAWAVPVAPNVDPGPAPGYEVLRPAPEARGGRGLLLDSMPHPLPPNVAPRRRPGGAAPA